MCAASIRIVRRGEPGIFMDHNSRGRFSIRYVVTRWFVFHAAISASSFMMAPVGLVSCHHLSERTQKLFHLHAGADRHAHERRQGREESSNFNTAIAHAVDDWSNFTPQIDHHEIRV